MYTLTTAKAITDKGKEITVYGIQNGIESYDGISADKEEVEKLCKLFNEKDLDCIHFRDAVEDFVVGKAFCIPEEKDL